MSDKDADKEKSLQLAKTSSMWGGIGNRSRGADRAPGFTLYSSTGTAKYLEGHGVTTNPLFKLAEGRRPNVLDTIKNGAAEASIKAIRSLQKTRLRCRRCKSIMRLLEIGRLARCWRVRPSSLGVAVLLL